MKQLTTYSVFNYVIPTPVDFYVFIYRAIRFFIALTGLYLALIDWIDRFIIHGFNGTQVNFEKGKVPSLWSYSILSDEFTYNFMRTFFDWSALFVIFTSVSEFLRRYSVLAWPFVVSLFFSYFFKPFASGEYLLFVCLLFTFFFVYTNVKSSVEHYFENIWATTYSELGSPYFYSLLVYEYSSSLSLAQARADGAIFDLFSNSTFLDLETSKDFSSEISSDHAYKSLENLPILVSTDACEHLITEESSWETFYALSEAELAELSGYSFEVSDFNFIDDSSLSSEELNETSEIFYDEMFSSSISSTEIDEIVAASSDLHTSVNEVWVSELLGVDELRKNSEVRLVSVDFYFNLAFNL